VITTYRLPEEATPAVRPFVEVCPRSGPYLGRGGNKRWAARPAYALSHVSCRTGGRRPYLHPSRRSQHGPPKYSLPAASGVDAPTSVSFAKSPAEGGGPMGVAGFLAGLFRGPGLWGYLTKRAELKYLKEHDGSHHIETMSLIERLTPGAVFRESSSDGWREVRIPPQPCRPIPKRTCCHLPGVHSSRVPHCRIQ
jgi:hypothetical protein